MDGIGEVWVEDITLEGIRLAISTDLFMDWLSAEETFSYVKRDLCFLGSIGSIIPWHVVNKRWRMVSIYKFYDLSYNFGSCRFLTKVLK